MHLSVLLVSSTLAQFTYMRKPMAMMMEMFGVTSLPYALEHEFEMKNGPANLVQVMYEAPLKISIRKLAPHTTATIWNDQGGFGALAGYIGVTGNPENDKQESM